MVCVLLTNYLKVCLIFFVFAAGGQGFWSGATTSLPILLDELGDAGQLHQTQVCRRLPELTMPFHSLHT